MRSEIARLNRHLGLHIFKPGYPTGRGQYMILDCEREAALAILKDAGFDARPLLGVGHDYNYGGSLYTITREVS